MEILKECEYKTRNYINIFDSTTKIEYNTYGRYVWG